MSIFRDQWGFDVDAHYAMAMKAAIAVFLIFAADNRIFAPG